MVERRKYAKQSHTKDVTSQEQQEEEFQGNVLINVSRW